MRFAYLLLFAIALSLSALTAASAQHPGGMPAMPAAAPSANPLEMLHGCQFLTVEGLTGECPYGTFEVYDGVVAMLPGGYPHGLALGGITIDFSNLPAYTPEDGALNLFREIDGPDSVLGFFSLKAAYLSASMSSGVNITDYGTVLTERYWDELTDTERAQFDQLFAQCASDGWTEGRSANLREPEGGEMYAAFWVEDEDGGFGTRWDFRADADGILSIEEYARGITWYAYPWAREEGEFDNAIQFERVVYRCTLVNNEHDWFDANYVHGFENINAYELMIEADFTAQEHRDKIQLISAPWVEIQEIRLTRNQNALGTPPGFQRGGNTLSPWIVTIDEPLDVGVTYHIQIEAQGDITQNFNGFGYGGAFRLDLSPLWPGEEDPVDVMLSLEADEEGLSALTSNGRDAGLSHGDSNHTIYWYTLEQEQTTRNQMLVLTQFPSRTIPANWGELEVYAPADLIDGVEQTEAVQAIGPIIDYYTALWGDREVDKLPVFILPDETGVQGFMSAGMVFILGGSGGHGGAGSSMGGMTALLAHELAHLWWGQDVSAPRWFVEAMANYGAAKFLEHQALVAQSPPAASTGGAPVPPAGGDPYFYRRYLMNFALGYELPLSLERRDELDDSASIYHNGPACMLTLDARLVHGLDPLLAELWRDKRGAPELSNDELRDYFLKAADPTVAELWDMYIERGIIPETDDEDETYRELVRTPERENYRSLLSWLMPARRKAMQGDLAGAIYCANRALEFRAEPKDYQWLAELTFQSGRVDEAIERCIVIMEDQQPDAVVELKVHYLLAQCYLAKNQPDMAVIEYTWVAQNGMAAGQISLVQDARAQLEALGAEVPEMPEVDAKTGATPNPHKQ